MFEAKSLCIVSPPFIAEAKGGYDLSESGVEYLPILEFGNMHDRTVLSMIRLLL